MGEQGRMAAGEMVTEVMSIQAQDGRVVHTLNSNALLHPLLAFAGAQAYQGRWQVQTRRDCGTQQQYRQQSRHQVDRYTLQQLSALPKTGSLFALILSNKCVSTNLRLEGTASE